MYSKKSIVPCLHCILESRRRETRELNSERTLKMTNPLPFNEGPSKVDIQLRRRIGLRLCSLPESNTGSKEMCQHLTVRDFFRNAV